MIQLRHVFNFHYRALEEHKEQFPFQETILDSHESTSELESDDEMCAYEKLRLRNIAEREKLFRDLKISQMK